MRRKFPALSLLALAAACPAPAPKIPAPSKPAALSCGAALPGFEAVSTGDVLLLGEIHGSEESPALFGRAVCLAAQRGSVIAAIELPSTEQERIDRFLDSDGGEAARAELLSGDLWTRSFQPGITSAAMLSLLSDLRVWNAAGARLRVFCFDVPEKEAGPDRDSRMAQHLAQVRREDASATLIALTGNIHARTKAGTPWDPGYVTMGSKLAQEFPEVRAVDLVPSGGDAWICLVDASGAPDCGVHPMTKKETSETGVVTWFSAVDERGYHGTLGLGLTHASRPAKEP